jgi:hypothetical protein
LKKNLLKTKKINRYWAIRIDFESFYAQAPQKPFWVNKLNDELSKLRPKRLPMTDIQVYDLFKKYYGYKKATKLKVFIEENLNLKFSRNL